VRLITSVLALTFALACGSDGPTAVASVDGTWNLQSVNGQTLPFNLGTSGTTKFEVTSEKLDISGSTYTATTTIRQTTNGQATSSTEVERGTFSRNANTLSFRADDGTIVTGTLNGSSISITSEGVTLIFMK
jgi:hypothetical protein